MSFDEINIKVNGVSFESDNMVYNDAIYLPIANLSRLLNLSVHYYEPTKTVYIGQIPIRISCCIFLSESIIINDSAY